ncbi:MAG: hypothetical protein GF344_15260 [Chitinivibrionales bacterium]|nr:hypothetical protein [Chitinivibrionales bacterium]MBD3358063.1 hypothetical protein [Chitinivibrionales bacterium]
MVDGLKHYQIIVGNHPEHFALQPRPLLGLRQLTLDIVVPLNVAASNIAESFSTAVNTVRVGKITVQPIDKCLKHRSLLRA